MKERSDSSYQNRSGALENAMADLDAEKIRAGLSGQRIGRKWLEVRASVDSSMDTLASAAAEAPDGAVLIVDFQTAGRGRRSRPWIAPAGTSLMFSVLFKPTLRQIPQDRSGELMIAAALAGREALNARLSKDPVCMIKWPNDLMVGDGKIAGLIAEAGWSSKSGKIDDGSIILGMGINVRQSEEILPEGATSLAQQSGESDDTSGDMRLDRSLLAVDILNALDREYVALCAGQSPVLRWKAALSTLGQRVEAEYKTDRISGIAEDVAPDGTLILRLDSGARLKLRAGDLSHSDVTLNPPAG